MALSQNGKTRPASSSSTFAPDPTRLQQRRVVWARFPQLALEPLGLRVSQRAFAEPRSFACGCHGAPELLPSYGVWVTCKISAAIEA